MLVTFFNTGARVQELLGTRPADLQLDKPSQVILRGKGQKERICPLWPETVTLLRGLLRDTGLGERSTEPLFRNHCGEPLTRFGARYLLQKYARKGLSKAPSLEKKKVHPHTFRHSAAVHMLQAGVDLVSISHWLGHSSVVVTNRYTAVDLTTKRAAIALAGPIVAATDTLGAWRKDESILTWLEAL
jgi:integrase